MSPKQIAAYIGVSEWRAREWLRDGTLPPIREDGRYYAPRRAVEALAEQRETQGEALRRHLQQKRNGLRRLG